MKQKTKTYEQGLKEGYNQALKDIRAISRGLHL